MLAAKRRLGRARRRSRGSRSSGAFRIGLHRRPRTRMPCWCASSPPIATKRRCSQIWSQVTMSSGRGPSSCSSGFAHVADRVDRPAPVLGRVGGEAPELDSGDLVCVDLLPAVIAAALDQAPVALEDARPLRPRVRDEAEAARVGDRARDVRLGHALVLDLLVDPEGEVVAAARRHLDTHAQEDRAVPALEPVVLGAQGVVIGEEDDVELRRLAAASISSGMRRRAVGVVRVEVNCAGQIVEPGRTDRTSRGLFAQPGEEAGSTRSAAA